MKLLYVFLAIIVVAGATGFAGYQVASRAQGAEIARIASVNVERSTRIRKGLEPKPVNDVKDLLDVGIGQDLFYMEAYESGALSDPTYAKQRARSISLVKQAWLATPPFALEDQTKSYINKVCAEAKGCPDGDIQVQKVQEPKGK